MNASAVRLTDRAAILLRGKDRFSWLNGLVTCDLARRADADGAYGLIVEKKGRIQTDFFLVPGSDTLVLAVPATLQTSVAELLDHHLIMEDVEIETPDLAFWQVHGAGASGLATELGAPWQGALDLLGEGGAIVAASREESDAFGSRLRAAVLAAGGEVLEEQAWESLRIERGLPRFGVDFDTTFYPQEAALERRAVSFDKGCYLGQEVVYMLENRGHVKRKLVPLDVDGSVAPAPGAPITLADGTVVGDVKSGTVGPSGKASAIAMVKWAQAQAGTELRAGELIARVR